MRVGVQEGAAVWATTHGVDMGQTQVRDQVHCSGQKPCGTWQSCVRFPRTHATDKKLRDRRNRGGKAVSLMLGQLVRLVNNSYLPVRRVGRVVSCGPSLASLVVSFPIFLFPIHLLGFFLLLVPYITFFKHIVGNTRHDTRHFGTW